MVVGHPNEWDCIWPVHKKNPFLFPWFVETGDCYDVSNLTATTGPKLNIFFEELKNEERAWISTIKGIFGEGHTILGKTLQEKFDNTTVYNIRDNEFFGLIIRASGQGQTPIQSLFVYGHAGGLAAPFNALSRIIGGAGHDIEPHYGRAIVHQGPIKCWFTRSSVSSFFGCGAASAAEEFAQRGLRRGAVAVGLHGIVVVAPYISTWYWPDVVISSGFLPNGKIEPGRSYNNATSIYTDSTWRRYEDQR